MLRTSVLATIAYYDALDYPLTEFETWKHLIAARDGKLVSTPSLGQVAVCLDSLIQNQTVVRKDGFVVLPGRIALIADRIRSEKVSVAKIKRAAQLVAWIAWVPFVRMIALTGSLSMKRGGDKSDWDLFVVLSQGAIWRGRTALSIILQIIGKRRHGRHIENRACLNHFVTDSSLEIAIQDLFSASEYRFMYTLLGRETERRFELVNRWMVRLKPTYQLSELPNRWLSQGTSWSEGLQRVLEQTISWRGLEKWLAHWQKRKIERNPNSQLPGAFILANDDALIFLPHPKGPVIFDRYKERLAAHGLSA